MVRLEYNQLYQNERKTAMETYHLALERGTGKAAYWANGHRKDTLILTGRRGLDCLSPDIWKYLGERIVTKAHLKINKDALLAGFNEQFGTSFNHLIID